MAVAILERTCTPEDLLAHPDGKHMELVDGQLVETEMGAESSWLAGELLAELRGFVRQAGIGRVFTSEMGYQCFAEDGSRVRKPDVSFVRAERLPADWRTYGFFPFPPDLAVEVISPNDFYSEVRRKVREYRDAGVAMIWVIDPVERCVEIHRAGGGSSFLGEGDELRGEDVLPGFTYSLAELLAGE